ncbi:MAG: CARDB domain-containing protein [Candidatus Thorarchaeota archaeon]|jgi:hypothetical protein
MDEVEAKTISESASSGNKRRSVHSLLLTAVVVLSSLVAIVSEEIPLATAEIFGQNVRVDDTGIDPSGQATPRIILSESGTIYVAWADSRNHAAFWDIYIASSLDGGETFEKNTKVNDNFFPSRQDWVDIATDRTGGLHAVWRDWRNDADGHTAPSGGIDGIENVTIYYSNSSDGGKTWSPNIRLMNGTIGYWGCCPYVAVDGKNTIHVVWGTHEGGTGVHHVFHTRSLDGGMFFSEPKTIGNSSGTARYPSIAVDENDVTYVVWEDNRNTTTGWDIWFAKSTDRGLNFKGHKPIHTDTRPIDQRFPRISARAGMIGVVWYNEPFIVNISFVSSFDGGQSFGSPVVVNDDFSPVWRDWPSLWIDETGYISVAWMTERNGNEDIYFANSTDKGQTFSANQRVNDDPGANYQRYVELTMDSNGYLYLVWMDDRENGNFDIYFTRAPPEIADLEPIGFSFDPPSPLTEWINVNLNATIRNNGDREATNVLVRFYDGDPASNVQIGPDQILSRIDANGGTGYAEAQWVATPGGLHTIYAVVDPENNVTESNETNNIATVDIGVISLRPPTVMQAVLSGNNLENVTLDWSLSPDDGNGSMTVTGYKIFRNMTYNSDGLGYSFAVTLPNGTHTFEDFGAGEGNLNNYFYHICARDVNNTTACSRTQAGKFTRQLARGPSLISIPLTQSDESVGKILQTVRFDKAWVYDSSNKKWKWYMTFKPYKGELRSINETRGFWVNATEDCNFTVAGILPIQTTIHLSKGWNLVGFPSFRQDYAVAELKTEVAGERIEGFDPSVPPYFLRLMLDGNILETGYGYWVNVADETIWVVASS